MSLWIKRKIFAVTIIAALCGVLGSRADADEPAPAQTTPPHEMTLEEELAATSSEASSLFRYEPPLIKGESLSGDVIQSRLVGHTLRLFDFGRVVKQSNKNPIDIEIKLNTDGTTGVTEARQKDGHRYYMTYHELSLYPNGRPLTLEDTALGHWSIENNHWCHQSDVINEGAKECYDVQMDGQKLSLFYGPCTTESSMSCRSGRKAGMGEVD